MVIFKFSSQPEKLFFLRISQTNEKVKTTERRNYGVSRVWEREKAQATCPRRNPNPCHQMIIGVTFENEWLEHLIPIMWIVRLDLMLMEALLTKCYRTLAKASRRHSTKVTFQTFSLIQAKTGKESMQRENWKKQKDNDIADRDADFMSEDKTVSNIQIIQLYFDRNISLSSKPAHNWIM